jgi:predicted TPR repeat methyltransferase
MRCIFSDCCGTGLTGGVVKPYSTWLTGVDLSAKMLAKARARGIYDELIEQELEAFLQMTDARFDLIVCADVLVYVGELSAIVAGAARSLKNGGYFYFTLEKADAIPSGTGYELGPRGRYSHHRSYVRRLLEPNFELIQMDDMVIRLEGGQPVTGMVVIARVPA